MIRLLYLVGNLGPGGLQRQLYYLLQTMDRRCYKPAIVVWSFKEDDVFVPEFRALGVPLHPLPSNVPSIAKLTAFRRLIRKLTPEVVHSYCFYTNIAVKCASFGLKHSQMGSIRNDFVYELGIGRVLGKLSARWPRTQICNSLAAAKSLAVSKSIFRPDSCYLVRNGLDVDQFKFEPQLPNYPRLLAVGRLHPEKRWDRLLNAISSLANRGIAFEVCLAGEGPLREQLEIQAKDLGIEGILKFLGHRSDITALLAESTFLINTADHEGCPNIVMEAMACGRAVVATDAGDVPFLVEDGKTGFVVPRGDKAMLLERIWTLIRDSELCRSMGVTGRAKAKREFEMDRLVNETFNAYRATGWREQQCVE